MSEMGYLHQIRQLVELQKVDDEIFEVRCALENAPKELEELRRQFTEIDNRRNLVLDKLSHMNEQKKRLSFEIDDDSARIKKSKNKMMSVGNSREYQAMVREMDNMEKSSRTREEERATLLEELQRQEEALNEIDVVHSRIKEEMDQKSASLEQTVEDAKARLESLNRHRGFAGEGIPGPIFRRYEFIRNRLEHPVIVPVRDAICSGCHIAVPPQTFIELQTGQQILSCPNCQRLIYWDEHFEAPQDQMPAAVKKEKLHANEDASRSDDGSEEVFAEDALQFNDDASSAACGQDVWPEDNMHADAAPMKPEFEHGMNDLANEKTAHEADNNGGSEKESD